MSFFRGKFPEYFFISIAWTGRGRGRAAAGQKWRKQMKSYMSFFRGEIPENFFISIAWTGRGRGRAAALMSIYISSALRASSRHRAKQKQKWVNKGSILSERERERFNKIHASQKHASDKPYDSLLNSF